MIKNIILAIVFITSSVYATEINWAKDYDSGVAQAKKAKKPIVFIISRDTCKFCVMLDNKTLKDEKVAKALNKNFIAIRSWTNKGDYIPSDLARYTPGLPGIWFLFSDGKPMFKPVLGYMEKDRFLEALGIIYTEFKKQNKGTK